MASIVKRLSGRFSLGKAKDADVARLKELSKMTYKEQAIWFMNAFWEKEGTDGNIIEPKFKGNDEKCEVVWNYLRNCEDLDPKGEEGNQLDELLAHRLLERIETVLTVVEMREVMRKVDVDFNKFVSLFEFLIYKFEADWRVMVNSTKEQGEEMKAILAETQALMDAATEALKECQRLAQAALDAEQKAKDEEATAVSEEAKAKEAEEDARKKEEVFAEAERQAQEAEDAEREEEAKVAAIVAELEAEEKAYADAIAQLSKDSKRNSIGVVKRGKASNELAQLKATETIGLRTAKLSQQAALRRQQKATANAAAKRAAAQKARKPFQEATAAAAQARLDAEEARVAAEQARAEATSAREEADAAVESSMESYREAEAALEKVKEEAANSNQGHFWMLDREFEENKKYMSKKQLASLTK